MNGVPSNGALLAALLTLAPISIAAQSSEGTWYAPMDTLAPGVHVIEVDSTYPVMGESALDVLESLHQDAPEHDGARRPGYHEWRFRYRYAAWQGPQQCHPRDIVLLARTVTVLPEWAGRERAPPDLATDWDAFLGAIETHEMGHRTLAVAHLDRIFRALELARSGRCEELPDALQRAVEGPIRDEMEEQRRYDAETEHGILQGTIWPRRD